MAENKFSLEGFEFRTGGINDLPELAVETHPNAGKSPEEAHPVLQKTEEVALAVEESTVSSGETSRNGFLGFMGKVRSTLPIIARVLPLLDSGIASALAPVSSALATQSSSTTKAIERSITEVQAVQRDLRTHVQNQSLQLKRVEEQLVRIREEVDHNNRENHEKIEQVRAATGTVKVLAIIGLVLLLVVLGLEGWILYRLHY
jgi:hypothetical protein